MAKMSKALRQAGKQAAAIGRSLETFSKSAAVFSADHPRLIERYEDKWVGVYQGKVAGSADTFDELARQIARQGIPLAETMIRRIDRKEKTLIL